GRGSVSKTLWFPAKGTIDLARGRHRAIRIARFGFLLCVRPASDFARCLAIGHVIGRLFGGLASCLRRRWRARIDRWMLLAFPGFFLRRFAIADSGWIGHGPSSPLA